MSTLTPYNGLMVVTPNPPGNGGLAINNNFKALSTEVSTVDPTAADDGTLNFVAGSRWYNTTSGVEWICLSNATGAAVWAAVTAGYLPLSGGTMAGNIVMGAHAIELGTGTTLATITGDAFGEISVSGSFLVGGFVSTGVLTSTGDLTVGSWTGPTTGGTVRIVAGGYAQTGITLALGSLSMNGNALNMNAGGGTGGTTLKLDGASIVDNGVTVYAPGPASRLYAARITSGVVSASVSGSYATDASAGNQYRLTLTGNLTLAAPSNPLDGQSMAWWLTQDATGSRTLTLSTGTGGFVVPSSLGTPTLSTAATVTDLLTAVYVSSSNVWRVTGFTKGYSV